MELNERLHLDIKRERKFSLLFRFWLSKALRRDWPQVLASNFGLQMMILMIRFSEFKRTHLAFNFFHFSHSHDYSPLLFITEKAK